MSRVFAFAICCLPAIGFAQEIHIAHCVDGGCPTGAPTTNDLVVREIYALSNNRDTKFADWVAYRVTRETIGTSDSLERTWKNDDLLNPSDTLEGEEKDEDDYKSAHQTIDTDRGHQAPLAAFAGTRFWRATNILSNITPQKISLNRGPWNRLEGAVRDAAYELREVYVVTGPLFDGDENGMKLPKADEDHKIPTDYFKVIAHNGSKRLVSFIFGQGAARNMDYCQAIVTLTEVEQKSGLKIFPRTKGWSEDMRSELGCDAAGGGH